LIQDTCPYLDLVLISSVVYGKAHSPMTFPYAEKIIELAPQIVMSANALDKQNQPIILETYDFNPKHFIENVSIDEYLVFLIYCLEYRALILEQLSDKYEKINFAILSQAVVDSSAAAAPYGVIMRFCNIRDLKGVSLGHMGQHGRAIVSSALRIGLPNYPDMLGIAYHVNVPWIFKASWSFIKKFLDEDIISKIQISSSNYMDVLLEGISMENIPASIGGKFELYNEPFEFDRSKSGPLYYEGAPAAEDMSFGESLDFMPSLTIPQATDIDNMVVASSSSLYEESKEDHGSWGYAPSNDLDDEGLPKQILPTANLVPSRPVVIVYPDAIKPSIDEMRMIWISGFIVFITITFVYLYAS
jgi:hypothetical protein